MHVTGLHVQHVCMTVRSSTCGTLTHTVRISVRTSGTRFQTVHTRVRVSGTVSQRYAVYASVRYSTLYEVCPQQGLGLQQLFAFAEPAANTAATPASAQER